MDDRNEAYYTGQRVMQDHLKQSFREASERFPHKTVEHLQALREVVKRDVLEGLNKTNQMWVPITGQDVSRVVMQQPEFWQGLRHAAIDFSHDMNHSLRQQIQALRVSVDRYSNGHSPKVA